MEVNNPCLKSILRFPIARYSLPEEETEWVKVYRRCRKGLGRELFSVLLEHVPTGEIVGMGRIVGDGGTVFHVCDMAVLPEYQRMGGGSLIMAEIMNFIDREAPLILM